MQTPKRRGEWRRQLGLADEYLTPDAIQKLKQDLARLEKARPAALEELQRTREMGDLSENVAYGEAKAHVGRINGGILNIRERLRLAKTIQTGANTSGRVAIGTTVEVEVNGKIKKFQILGTQQADPNSGKISFHSPVGAALMGKKAGDMARVRMKDKEIEYRIIKVE